MRSFDAGVFAVWLKLMTTSPGLLDGCEGRRFICSRIMSCLLLTHSIKGHSSWSTPCKQSLILLCEFAL